MASPSKKARRTPSRRNAKATVEVLFEATARILESEGRSSVSTTRIARKAGVSVGTVYDYFANKDELLMAMARLELESVRDRVLAALRDARSEVPPVRRAIRALLQGYGARHRARRHLMEYLFAQGGTEEMARPLYEAAELLRQQPDALLPIPAAPLRPLSLFVLTRAVDSVVRAAIYENAPFVRSPEFEDELVLLVQGFLSALSASQDR